MEIAGLVVAVLAVLVAGASALYAKGANVRADQANATAAAALDLQTRIDEREREFRDVTWRWSYEGRTGFTLYNDGLTDAVSVTLVLYDDHDRESHALGDIPARTACTVSSDLADGWMREHAEHLPLSTAFAVHWSSPLGVPDEFRARASRFFEPLDD